MKNVAIVCGGDSGEFEISVKSAQVVKNNLDPELYNSKIIVVSKKGWYGLLKDGTRVDVDKNDFSISVGGHRTKFDVVFNAVHGEPGENGPLSGYLELLGIPCTSSPLTTCALTFHKDFCKRLVASYGANVAPSVLINEGEKYDADAIVKQLGLPLFVKPTCNGSSVGVTKVKTKEELVPAIFTARAAGRQVMCEKFVDGREFGCGAMCFKGKMMVFPLTEICSKTSFSIMRPNTPRANAMKSLPPKWMRTLKSKSRQLQRCCMRNWNARALSAWTTSSVRKACSSLRPTSSLACQMPALSPHKPNVSA